MRLYKPYDSRVDLWGIGFFLYKFLDASDNIFGKMKYGDKKAYKFITEGQFDMHGEPWKRVSDDAKDLI